jgi:hypothetical protein
MKLKIYYDRGIGQNIISREQHNNLVWANTFLEYETTDIHNMLDVLGIDYEWSNDPNDSIAFANLGSCPPESSIFVSTCAYLSDKFKKCIVYTSQEPWRFEHITKLINAFDNLFFMDASTPLKDTVVHERYIPFMGFMCRQVSIPTQITVAWPDRPRRGMVPIKKFNCLMNQWRPEKHMVMSLLNYYHKKATENNFVSYNTIPSSDLDGYPIEQAIAGFEHILDDSNDDDFKEYALRGIAENPFPVRELPNDVRMTYQHEWRVSDTFSTSFRVHPPYCYTNTYVSLVCESANGVEPGGVVPGGKPDYSHFAARQFITEKSILPMMNEHLFLAYAGYGFYDTLEELGFRCYDEVFDYSFDFNSNRVERAKSVVDQVVNTSMNTYHTTLGNNSETYKKILHNKKNLFNRNSQLWQIIRNNFEQNIQRFMDF